MCFPKLSGRLAIVRQLADVRVRRFVSTKFRSFVPTLPVPVLVVFVNVVVSQRWLCMSAELAGQRTGRPRRFAYISAFVVSQRNVFADRSHAHASLGKPALFVVHVGSLGFIIQSGPLRDRRNLRFHLIERSCAVFERNLVTEGFRQRKVLGS